MKNKRPPASVSARGSRPDKKQSKPADRSKRIVADGSGKRRPAKTETEAGVNSGERIAKRLARAGVASRRDAEAMIAEGRVRVNGKILSSPAFNVSAGDRVEVDGAPLPEVERTRLFLFHKPAGVVTTTRDPEGRSTIFAKLPEGLPRLVTVGRLDINTEGLMLLTNDGGLSRVLELPTTGWLRRYRVRVHGHVEPAQLAELEKGIAVDGVFYGSIEATLDRTQGTNSWLTLGFREGKNREVKNVLGALGLQVTRLIRISFGPFQLGDLPEGAVQEVKGRTLRDQLGERLVEASGANFDAPVAVPFANRPVRAGEERRDKLTEKKRDRSPEGRAPTNRKKAREEHREDVRERLQTKPPRRGEGKPDRPARTGRPEREVEDRRSGGPGGARAGSKRFERAEGREGSRVDKPRSGGDDRPFRERRRHEGDDRGAGGAKAGQGDRSGFKSKSSSDSRGGKGAIRDDGNRSRTAHVWMAPGARPVGKKQEEKAAGERPDRRTERSRTGPPRKNDEGRGGASAQERSRNDRPPRSGPSKPRSSGPRPSGKR